MSKNYTSLFNFIVSVALCIWLSACGRSNVSGLEQATSEVVVSTTAYPAVVMVVMPGGLGLCTGTFISANTVLTAAHCTTRNGTYYIQASFGSFSTSHIVNLGTGTLEDENDLALLILDEDVADIDAGEVYRVGTDPIVYEQVRLVGFGCNNLQQKSGSGVKRTGENQIYGVAEYIELLTPDTGSQSRGILGAANRAGTCFGDSGGPLLRETGDGFAVLGVSHAGGTDGETILSQFTNLNRDDNFNAIAQQSDALNLGIFDGCRNWASGYGCNSQNAFVEIFSFIKVIWNKLALLLR